MPIHNPSPVAIRIVYIKDIAEFQVLLPDTTNLAAATYHTSDIDDAIDTGHEMAKTAGCSICLPPVIYYYEWDHITDEERLEETYHD